MWLKLCEILYNKDNNKFKEIATWHKIRGRKKSYIVYEADKIAQNITAPLRFLNTGIILEGTTSTTQKIKIILKMLDIYNISHSSVKIYLKSDRHPRHGQEPIGIYIDKTYDYKTEIKLNMNIGENDKPIEYDSTISTGKRVYDYFQDYFANTNSDKTLSIAFINCYILSSKGPQTLENVKFIASEFALMLSLVLYPLPSCYELS